MDYQKQLANYLAHLDVEVVNRSNGRPHRVLDSHNANLIRAFARDYQSLPSEPGDYRVLVTCHRLKSIADMLGHKPLDCLTEEDLKELNRVIRERKLKAGYEFRKTLKRFLKLKDKKKYFDLIDSEYLKAPNSKNNCEKPVNPNEFWEPEQMEAYIKASKAYSPRQLAWAALWLTCGGRPHEILGLRKEDVLVKNGQLVVKVQEGKTGSRMIVLEPQETRQIWEYLAPYLNTLNENEKLFDIGWTRQAAIHKQLCEQINLPNNKARNLYIARKMCLTRFYNTYGLAKAAAMAGHTPGAKAMRHYVALKETELFGQELPKIVKKVCPNPNCCAENDASETQCNKCKGPLDKQAFAAIFNQNIEEKINNQLEIVKKDFMIKIMKLQKEQATQEFAP
jgi:integrase